MSFDHDVVIIGSGFGGSVSALRLTEKGYKVAVLEAGARFDDAGFARPRGTEPVPVRPEARLLRASSGSSAADIILAGAGRRRWAVYEIPCTSRCRPFFADPQWAEIADWKAELPCYDQAKRMLGVTIYPDRPRPTRRCRGRRRHGHRRTFHPTPVGVFFGAPGSGRRPVLRRRRPAATGCTTAASA